MTWLTDRAETTKSPLVERVRSGVGWNVASSLIGQFIGFLRSIALARILAPEDFGLFAMALTIVAASNAVTTIGLDRTIVATKFETRDELKAHLDTVWSVELVKSFILALLVSATAFPMSRFYGEPRLKFVIPILGLVSLIHSLQNIGLVILRKEISFGRIFWFDLATSAGGIALTVALAVVMKNVWALVIGLLLTAAIQAALSYAFHPYRPRLAFEKTVLYQALSFGKFTVVFAVASYVVNMADNIMVGRVLGANALGNYSLAFNIASAPIIIVVFSLEKILFPAFSEIRLQSPKRLEPAFQKAFSLSLIALVAMAMPFFLFGNEIVRLLFGGKWTTAGSVLRILALAIPLRGLTMITTTVFWSLNRPKEAAVGRTLEAIIFLGVLYPLTRAFGLAGVAWAGVIVYAFACVNRLVALKKLIPGISPKLFLISLSDLKKWAKLLSG